MFLLMLVIIFLIVYLAAYVLVIVNVKSGVLPTTIKDDLQQSLFIFYNTQFIISTFLLDRPMELIEKSLLSLSKAIMI